MSSVRIGVNLLGVALLSFAGSVHAQQTGEFDLGKREYDASCVICHGPDGKGDGYYKPFLTTSPTDLTVLSKGHGGVFPFDRVYSIIDGREQIGAHGPRDMPIWGSVYNINAAKAYINVPSDIEPSARDAYIRNRIRALTEFIARLQAK